MSRKVLFIEDGSVTRELLLETGIMEQFSDFPDAEICFAQDLSPLKTGTYREARLKLEKEGPEWVEYEPEFLEALADAEVAVIHYSGASSTFFRAAKNLRLLCTMRSGTENINMRAAAEHGVVVCTSPGRAAEPVADFSVTLMLALARNLVRNNMVSVGRWPDQASQPGLMLCDTVIGLVGFGIIGQKVARRMAGFGSTIIAYDPFADAKVANEMGVRLVTDLKELCGTADIISVHARLTAETKHLIDREHIALFKPTAFFVNTARAGLVEEDALVEALQREAIAGAALDVFSVEPLPGGHPLLTLPNVISTAHCAGHGGSFIHRSTKASYENITAYFKKQPLHNTASA